MMGCPDDEQAEMFFRGIKSLDFPACKIGRGMEDNAPTLLFNGYGEYVADFYKDLQSGAMGVTEREVGVRPGSLSERF